jgi:cold shock CspA family protein
MNTAVTRFNGTLKKWNVDRGFGFVVAEHGDQELFVHVSAFPRDGRQPFVGEPLSFEMEQGADGRQRAVRVRRPGDVPATQSTRSRERPTDAERHRHSKRTEAASSSSSSFGTRLIAALLLTALGWFAYGEYRGYLAERSLAAGAPQGLMAAPEIPAVAPPAPAFQCDGRLHCSQMTSCREAKLFLKNCPGIQMDGDGDGIPCEKQWCTGFFGG